MKIKKKESKESILALRVDLNDCVTEFRIIANNVCVECRLGGYVCEKRNEAMPMVLDGCWCDGWRCSTDLPINSYPLSSNIHNAMGDEFCIVESVKSQLFARNAEAPPIHTRIHAKFKPPKQKEKRKSPSQTCSSLSISFHYLDGTHVNLNGKNILNGKICSCDKGILQIYRLGNGIKHII